MSISRINKKYQLNWLLDMINEKNKELNYHIVYMWWHKYEIVDLKDYWRTIKRWTLDFLIWFCEWFLYIK
jgi:hypothetical protein